MEEYIYIEGTVDAVLYSNEENGYSVLKVVTDTYEEITATGTMPNAKKGEEICMSGRWQTHKTYGDQFVVDAFEISLPSSEKGIVDYLSSKAIKGIGPKAANLIVERFGEDTFEIIAKSPELLTEIRGISLKKAEEISKNFLRQTQLRFIIEFLLTHNLPMELASKLYKKLGDDALFEINSNPYILCDDFYDVSFLEIDSIALKLDMDFNSDVRCKAGILYVLKHNLQNGHSFIPEDKLVLASINLLEHDEEQVKENIENLILEQKIHTEKILSLKAVYLYDVYSKECFICDYLSELSLFEYGYDFDIDELILTLEQDNNIKYATKQKEAIYKAGQNGVVVLTGGPGTGKTTTVRGIVNLFECMGLNVVLAAPTGRAAKRLGELCSVEAKTIHRLLESSYDIFESKMVFQKNAQNTIDADVVIVDEASMIDINLVAGLLKALKFGTRVVFVGDPDQLPPVGAGNFLTDVINSEKFNVISLDEIFRQAKESMIVLNAHGVNIGKMPVSSDSSGDFFIMNRFDELDIIDTVSGLCKDRLPKYYNLDPSQIQVIAPAKKSKVGTATLNKRLQEELNPKSDNKNEKRFGDIVFREGDRVMQIKNNYDVLWCKDELNGAGIFNGDIGKIIEIDNIEELMTINFDEKIAIYSFDMLSELDLAYALTVHKAQGSEFDAVVLCISNTSSKLLTRSILYTAITRAKNLMVIVGDKSILEQMVLNNFKNKRYSGLKTRFKEVL